MHRQTFTNAHTPVTRRIDKLAPELAAHARHRSGLLRFAGWSRSTADSWAHASSPQAGAHWRQWCQSRPALWAAPTAVAAKQMPGFRGEGHTLLARYVWGLTPLGRCTKHSESVSRRHRQDDGQGLNNNDQYHWFSNPPGSQGRHSNESTFSMHFHLQSSQRSGRDAYAPGSCPQTAKAWLAGGACWRHPAPQQRTHYPH